MSGDVCRDFSGYAYHARSAHGYSEDLVHGSRFHLVVKESKFSIKHRLDVVSQGCHPDMRT